MTIRKKPWVDVLSAYCFFRHGVRQRVGRVRRDPPKNSANVQKHGASFEGAALCGCSARTGAVSSRAPTSRRYLTSSASRRNALCRISLVFTSYLPRNPVTSFAGRSAVEVANFEADGRDTDTSG